MCELSGIRNMRIVMQFGEDVRGMIEGKIPKGIIGIQKFYRAEPFLDHLSMFLDPLFQFPGIAQVPQQKTIPKNSKDHVVALVQRIYSFGKFLKDGRSLLFFGSYLILVLP